MQLKHLHESNRQHLLLEISISGRLRNLFNKFVGAGIDPKDLPQPSEEIVLAGKGLGGDVVEYEERLKEAENLTREAEEDYRRQGKWSQDKLDRAHQIYKWLADVNVLTGLREKSYGARESQADHLHVVADMDNLKFLNSALGHKGANEVIKKFAAILQKHFETQAFQSKVYRPHGKGDEFVVLVNIHEDPPGVVSKKAMWAIEQAQKATDELASLVFVKDEDKARATATVGVSFDAELADRLVDAEKQKRRKVRFKDQPAKHVIIAPDVEKHLREMTR